MKSLILSTIILTSFATGASAFNVASIKEAADIPNFAPVSADEIVAPVPTIFREFGPETKAKWTIPLQVYVPNGICLLRDDTNGGSTCKRAVNFLSPSAVDAKTPQQVEALATSLTDFNPDSVTSSVLLLGDEADETQAACAEATAQPAEEACKELDTE